MSNDLIMRLLQKESEDAAMLNDFWDRREAYVRKVTRF